MSRSEKDEEQNDRLKRHFSWVQSVVLAWTPIRKGHCWAGRWVWRVCDVTVLVGIPSRRKLKLGCRRASLRAGSTPKI